MPIRVDTERFSIQIRFESYFLKMADAQISGLEFRSQFQNTNVEFLPGQVCRVFQEYIF